MAQAVLYGVEEGVAVLTIQNPPVNALAHTVRKGLLDGIATALEDDTARAIVIIGAGRTFPAGADISEFDRGFQEPLLPEVCNRIESATKPVVAALHGTALGGGFEVALSAHYRVADQETRFGLPEVTLGVLPGAGGTQRTPRLVGAATALDLMLTGNVARAADPAYAALFDAFVEGDLRAAAISFANALIEENKGPRPTRDIRDGLTDGLQYQDEVATARKRVASRPEYAPEQIVRCVEAAALLPFDQGLQYERAAFEDCLATDQSASLRHAFFAERRAAKFPEKAKGEARRIQAVGIVGSGALAASIALECLRCGWQVTMATETQQAARQAQTRVEQLLENEVARQNIGADQAGRLAGNLAVHPDLVALAEADLILECSQRAIEVKRDVFTQLDAVVKEGAVLVDAVPPAQVDVLAQATETPEDVLGLHLYTPLRRCKIAEVILGSQTGADAVATVLGFLKRQGKTPVRAERQQIGPRILAAYRRAADYLVEAGATPYLVDQAMRGFGMPLGPYQALDMEGLATPLDRPGPEIRAARAPGIRSGLVRAGRNGVRSGGGFYFYEQGDKKPRQDRDVISFIRQLREARGITVRGFDEAEIRYRCLAAMANEGARLLREGVASRPSDIDTVMIGAYGFPRWQGGPMKAADLAGLLHMKVELERFAQEEPTFWAPEPMFNELSLNGRNFDSLND